MFFGGDGSGLPLPQNGLEWLGMIIALVLVVWVLKRWWDGD